MKRHPNFKGGKIKTSHGYIQIFVGKRHHLADCRGYAYEHRLNAEIKIGRKLRKGEEVHHDDENKSNNTPSNLIISRTRAHHFYLHRKKKSNKKKPNVKNKTIICKCGCGEKFLKYDKSNRPRKYISGHNPRKRKTINGLMKAINNGKRTIKEFRKCLRDNTTSSIKTALSKMTAKNMISRTNHGEYAPFGAIVWENKIIECACGCGRTFLEYDKSKRKRKYISGHNSYK